MICDFCKQEAPSKPLPVLTSFDIYFCEPCMAEYVYWSKDGIQSARHIYKVINNKMYRWSVSYKKDYGYLFYIAEPGIPGERPNRGEQILKRFTGHLPDITPTNIEEKIRTILVFM